MIQNWKKSAEKNILISEISAQDPLTSRSFFSFKTYSAAEPSVVAGAGREETWREDKCSN